MSDYICACTVASSPSSDQSIDDADPLLDLNGLEEQELPFLTVGTGGEGDKVTVLVLETRVQVGRLEAMVSVGLDGCGQIRGLLDAVVREHGRKVLEARVS